MKKEKSKEGLEVFKEEAAELLLELESALLELEDHPGDADLISRVFRALHTIKGSGAMFGFDDVSSFTNDLETAFEHVRDGKIPVTRELIDLTLGARDLIREMIFSQRDEPVDQGEIKKILSTLKTLVPDTPGHLSEQGGDREDVPAQDPAGPAITYRIRFRPSKNVFARGVNVIPLFNELKELGPCRVMAQTENIPELKDMDPEACYTYWDIVLTTDKGENAIKDVFIFVDDEDGVLLVETLAGENAGLGEEDHNALREVLVEQGSLRTEELRDALSDRKRRLLAQEEAGGEVPAPGTRKRRWDDTGTSIRVASDKLDVLADLVGELVTVQARLTQIAATRNDPEVLKVSEEVERLTEDLRDNTMSIRMVPVGSTFKKFRRLVRDLSADLGKEIQLTTKGGETELDKTVIERLSDPLVHLIRNCVDHGIEEPAQRKAAGKPVQGTVHLSAEHSGGNVLIHITDDGKGLDYDAVLERAVAMGLAVEGQDISEKEACAMILAPGFSTAREVTNVSGRGVGLDVVKKAIDSLGGEIEIQSTAGHGMSVTLRLPLTLAIIEGLLVKISEEFFVIQLSAVEECIELENSSGNGQNNAQIVNIRGKAVPYIRLRDRFGVPGERPALEQVVITNIDGQHVGFTVDSVVGENQTVIKSLGRFYKDIEGVSGATILGDGTVALIIDCQMLFRAALKEEALGNSA